MCNPNWCMFQKNKREKVVLNGREVTVIKPRKHVSFEEGDKRIEELIKRVKSKEGA